VRATLLPTALPVAAAALVLVAAALAPLAIPSTALAERWLRPVPGEVARPFSYAHDAPFAAGAHRGADLAAAPGTAVRAARAGRVVHAGAVAGHDDVVSVSCGGWRVSYLPLASVAVTAGAMIHAGAPLGTVAHGHGGLHLGIRREGDPFGYEDPMTLLPAVERPFAPAPRGTRPRPAVRRPVVARPANRPAVQRPDTRPAVPRPAVPRAATRPALPPPRPPLARPEQSYSPAPWPVWAGLAVLLCGAAGSRTVALRRRRVAHAHVPVAVTPR